MTAHEIISEQFRKWELPLRGWDVWDYPVRLEPTFIPLTYSLPSVVPDDGRVRTAGSSFLSSVRGLLLGSPRESAARAGEGAEKCPEPFYRERVQELTLCIPPQEPVTRDVLERILEGARACSDPISFEVLGTAEAIRLKFVSSPSDTPILKRLLATALPASYVLEDDVTLEELWLNSEDEYPLIFELALAREPLLPLVWVNDRNADPFLPLFSAFGTLLPGEVGVFQVLFTRSNDGWREEFQAAVTTTDGKPVFQNAPELFDGVRKKTSKSINAVVVRVGVTSVSWERKLELSRSIALGLSGFGALDTNALVALDNAAYPIAVHEEDLLARQTHRAGMLLGADELVSLLPFPRPPLYVPKLLNAGTRTKPVPERFSGGDLCLGDNKHTGRTASVYLSLEDRFQHTVIIGASGSGKSTLLFNCIESDLRRGNGFAVVDPHGDLVEQVLAAIPRERIDDVILLDPADPEYAVGFNILQAHSELEKNLLASDLVSIFERLSTSWGDQMGSVFKNAVLAFLESDRGGTLADLRRFLIEPDFRDEFLESVKDPDVVYYWRKSFALLSGGKSIGPIVTRLETFLTPKPARHIVSQRESKLDFAEIMDQGKIFLAKLSQGLIGRENSFLLGSLIMAKFQQTAMARQHLNPADRRPFFIFADEFVDYVSPSLSEILTGARKYRVGLSLAYQHLSQLDKAPTVADAVQNAHTRVCFRVSERDARNLEKSFSFFKAEDLQNLKRGEALCTIEGSNNDFNLHVRPPTSGANSIASEVIARSRQQFGTLRTSIQTAPVILPQRDRRDKADDTQRRAEPVIVETPKTIVAPPPLIPVENSVHAPPPRLLQVYPVPSLVEVEYKTPKLQKSGKGGHEHTAIQRRIKAAMEALGYTVGMEIPTNEPRGYLDLWFEQGNEKIAIEISVTTTVDQEVGNILKRLHAGFARLVFLSSSERKRKLVYQGAIGALGAEKAGCIEFFSPDEFLKSLPKLPERSDMPGSQKKRMKGLTIKVSHSPATLKKHQAAEAATIAAVSSVLGRK